MGETGKIRGPSVRLIADTGANEGPWFSLEKRETHRWIWLGVIGQALKTPSKDRFGPLPKTACPYPILIKDKTSFLRQRQCSFLIFKKKVTEKYTLSWLHLR